jgi:hypothetical protein
VERFTAPPIRSQCKKKTTITIYVLFTLIHIGFILAYTSITTEWDEAVAAFMAQHNDALQFAIRVRLL